MRNKITSIDVLILVVFAPVVLWQLWRSERQLKRQQTQFRMAMGFFGSGDKSNGMCTGQNFDFSASDSSRARSGSFQFGKGPEDDDEDVPAKPAKPVQPKKAPVKIGSLPTVPAFVWHLLLAILAAVLVHLAIHFYKP